MNILKNKKCNIKINDEEIETLTRWQDPAIKDLQQELERYKNIIDELENYIAKEWYCFDNESVEFEVSRDILNKLKELKGE